MAGPVGKVLREQGWVGEIAAPFLLQQQSAGRGADGEHCNSGNVGGRGYHKCEKEPMFLTRLA